MLPNDFLNVHLKYDLDGRTYAPKFKEHIMGMFFYFLQIVKKKPSQFNFGYATYLGLEQTIMEQLGDVDWTYVEDEKDKFYDILSKLTVNKTLGNDLLNFTTNIYENYLICNIVHKTNQSTLPNPWLPLVELVQKGYLFFLSKDQSILKKYDKKSEEKFFFVIANEDSIKINPLSTFSLRCNIAFKIVEYLENEALGLHNAVSYNSLEHNILRFFDNNNIKNDIKNVLKELHNQKIISSSKDNFFIPKRQDLLRQEEFEKLHNKRNYLLKEVKKIESLMYEKGFNIHSL